MRFRDREWWSCLRSRLEGSDVVLVMYTSCGSYNAVTYTASGGISRRFTGRSRSRRQGKHLRQWNPTCRCIVFFLRCLAVLASNRVTWGRIASIASHGCCSVLPWRVDGGLPSGNVMHAPAILFPFVLPLCYACELWQFKCREVCAMRPSLGALHQEKG